MRKMENLNAEKFRTACARCSHTACKSPGAWEAKIQVLSSSHSVYEISLTAGQKMAESLKFQWALHMLSKVQVTLSEFVLSQFCTLFSSSHSMCLCENVIFMFFLLFAIFSVIPPSN